MRILGFGTYDEARHPRIGVLLEGLRAHGDQVVEANAPLGFSTAERVAMLAKPWLTYRLVGRVLARWWTIARRARQARRATPFDVIVVGYLGHFDVVLARALFPRDRILLDQLIFAADTARDRAGSHSMLANFLGALDALAIRSADVVAVDTNEHLELVAPKHRHKAVVVAVGAGQAWFAAGERRRGPEPSAPLRVVFFGLFTPLHGAAVIGEALAWLADCPDIEITMIGSGQDSTIARQKAANNTHVTWMEWVEPETLPALVADHDVCLGIFGTTAKATRVVPNKVYQGAAAGCAIVTSDTLPQRRALGEAAVFVPSGDPRAIADLLRQLSIDRHRLSALCDAARRRSLAEFTAPRIVSPLRTRLASNRPTGVSRGGPL